MQIFTVFTCKAHGASSKVEQSYVFVVMIYVKIKIKQEYVFTVSTRKITIMVYCVYLLLITVN